MPTITETSHRHHEAILATVNDLLPIAEAVRAEPMATLRPKLEAAREFLVGQLLPHMEMAEARLFPALEELLSDTMAMSPMRREHAEVRGLVEQLGRRLEHLHDPIGVGEAVALRRILFRLFAILKVHLGEEELYLPVLEHNLSPETARAIAAGMEHATVHPM